jgi:tetratricopeptide (TPR) repeat protein
MRTHALVLAWAALAAATATAQTATHKHYKDSPEAAKPGPDGQLAPRLQNLGKHTFKVTTRSPRAQLFVNQGLNLSYGFNHAEALRSFKEAARLDPDCAMALWGQALVQGPNINVPMDPAAEAPALEAARKAVALKGKVTLKERDYIDAVAQRYSGKAEDRSARDKAYADAMRAVSKKYPSDLDAATLFAEAAMDLRPWHYWLPDGEPQPGIQEVVQTLEAVLAKDPDHPGANHLYIHVVEAVAPARAEKAAERLLPLVPGAGHLVHMPGHIFYGVGRYADAVSVNQKAVLADEDYIAQCRAQGIYPLGYYPHNTHFLAGAAMMEGASKQAIDAAVKTAALDPVDAVKQVPVLQAYLLVPYSAWERFGKWDEILAASEAPFDSPFSRGVWHYARGRAFIGKGKLDEARAELQKVRDVLADPDLAKLPATFSYNTPGGILRIAPEVLEGELAAKQGDLPGAVAHLETAVRFEDALTYTEPPDWPYPVRHDLGAVLLQANRAAEAEVVYWDDLRQHPRNGWSLYGLAQALKAQGKTDLAAQAEERFKKAWEHADVTLQASRF